MSFLSFLRSKPPEIKVLDLIEKHLSLSLVAADNLQKAVEAKMADKIEGCLFCIRELNKAEEEADNVRRDIEKELAGGILPPLSRADMARLTERLDNVPDWCKQTGRILEIISANELPEDLKGILLETTQMTNKCVHSLADVVRLLYTDHESALNACNTVEILEHEIDNLYIETLMKFYESDLKPNTLLLANELAESLEMIGDSCEDAADLIRVVVVSTFL
jgi:predicted phosphate transport protein (TIGR00153 family)